LNLNSTSVKCVLVDDISDLDFVNLYTDNTPNLSFSETNCLFINSLSQHAGYALDTLSVNNIETVFGHRGFIFDLYSGHFEVPKGEGKHSMFAHGQWIGGIAETGNLHLAAQTYRQQGVDFYPGPVSDSIYQNNETMGIWDRQWKLTKDEIDNHIANYAQADYIMPEAIFSWPAHGNIAVGQSYNLAPYIDVDNNNIYEPHNGDYPCIKGHEAIFLIRNDVGNFHTESGHYDLKYIYSTNLSTYMDSIWIEENFIDTFFSANDASIYYLYESNGNATTQNFFVGFDTTFYENKIGLEQHLMFYAFNDSTNSALNNTIFVTTTLHNMQNKNFSDFTIGIWNDSDLGHYLDDYVGCNVGLNLGYTYNGDAEDEGASGYGTTPPAIGVKLLDAEMNAFLHYQNNFTDNGNPENTQHFYNYLTAKWKDNSPFTYGGNGYGGEIPSHFMFPGNSDPTGIGTNGLITSADWENSQGWTEETAGNLPADRRFIQSIESFDFFAGDEITINYSFVWSRASEGDNLTSVEQLFIDAQTIQDYFDTHYMECETNEDIGQLGTYYCDVSGCIDPQNGTGIYSSIEECQENCIVSIIENNLNLKVYPNPSFNIFNIEFNSDSKTEISVTNILGEQVYNEFTNTVGEFNTQIDLSDYSKGIYNLTIKTSNKISNHKLILQ
jgi:hypothetical protein